jgi:hypothetical protein
MHQECDAKLTSEQPPQMSEWACKQLKHEQAMLCDELVDFILDVQFQLESPQINRLALHDAIDRAGWTINQCGQAA